MSFGGPVCTSVTGVVFTRGRLQPGTIRIHQPFRGQFTFRISCRQSVNVMYHWSAHHFMCFVPLCPTGVPGLRFERAGNSKPATGRTDRAESETTAHRPDTTSGSGSTNTRGYASATAPPPPRKKQQGNTPQTRPARTSGPPHSSWKQTDPLPGPRQTGPSAFL